MSSGMVCFSHLALSVPGISWPPLNRASLVLPWIEIAATGQGPLPEWFLSAGHDSVSEITKAYLRSKSSCFFFFHECGESLGKKERCPSSGFYASKKQKLVKVRQHILQNIWAVSWLLHKALVFTRTSSSNPYWFCCWILSKCHYPPQDDVCVCISSNRTVISFTADAYISC